MGAHQPVAALPVQPARHGIPHGGEVPLHNVPHLAARPAHAGDGEGAPVHQQLAEVAGLAAARGVERGAIQGHGALVGVHRRDGGRELAQVRIALVE